jgi:chromosome segregation ATPase
LQNPNQRGELEEVVRDMKRRVEMWSHDESSYRAAETAAAGDLTEQAKLAELQQRLDRLEQQLESLSTTPAHK